MLEDIVREDLLDRTIIERKLVCWGNNVRYVFSEVDGVVAGAAVVAAPNVQLH